MRTDECARMLFEYVTQIVASHNCIEEPDLGRRKRRSNYTILQYVDGFQSTSDDAASSTPRDHYRKVYFEVVDVFISSLNERFEQETYKVYLSIENVLIRAINGKELPSDLKL